MPRRGKFTMPRRRKQCRVEFAALYAAKETSGVSENYPMSSLPL